MKLIGLLLIALFLVACSRTPSTPLVSPSGQYSVTTDIPGDSAGPTRRLSLRLNILEIKTKKEIQFQTGASDIQKWALNWTLTGSLVLYSSDVGTSTYEITENKIIERSPTEEEKEIERLAYETRYGRKPN